MSRLIEYSENDYLNKLTSTCPIMTTVAIMASLTSPFGLLSSFLNNLTQFIDSWMAHELLLFLF
jgi:hypothetical protein